LEWEILEIRLNELNGVIDKFVLIETDCTFNGGTKKVETFSKTMFSNSSSEKFLTFFPFLSKIHIFNPQGFCHNHGSLRNGFNGFNAENDIRSYASIAARAAGAYTGDLFVFSDVDEIPRQSSLQLLQICDFGNRIHLSLDSYRYSFEHRLWPEFVFRSTVSVIGRIPDSMITNRFHYHTNLLLGDAGWHCSWCFKHASEVVIKMKSFSHSDRITSPHLLEISNIKRKFCTGEDPFELMPEATNFLSLVALSYPMKLRGISHVPDYVAQHPDKFRYLLPGGCAAHD